MLSSSPLNSGTETPSKETHDAVDGCYAFSPSPGTAASSSYLSAMDRLEEFSCHVPTKGSAAPLAHQQLPDTPVYAPNGHHAHPNTASYSQPPAVPPRASRESVLASLSNPSEATSWVDGIPISPIRAARTRPVRREGPPRPAYLSNAPLQTAAAPSSSYASVNSTPVLQREAFLQQSGPSVRPHSPNRDVAALHFNLHALLQQAGPGGTGMEAAIGGVGGISSNNDRSMSPVTSSQRSACDVVPAPPLLSSQTSRRGTSEEVPPRNSVDSRTGGAVGPAMHFTTVWPTLLPVYSSSHNGRGETIDNGLPPRQTAPVSAASINAGNSLPRDAHRRTGERTSPLGQPSPPLYALEMSEDPLMRAIATGHPHTVRTPAASASAAVADYDASGADHHGRSRLRQEVRQVRAQQAFDAQAGELARRLDERLELVFALLRRIMVLDARHALTRDGRFDVDETRLGGERGGGCGARAPSCASASASHSVDVDEEGLRADLVLQLEAGEEEVVSRTLSYVELINRHALQWINEGLFSASLQLLRRADGLLRRGAGRVFRYLPDPLELRAALQNSGDGVGGTYPRAGGVTSYRGSIEEEGEDPCEGQSDRSSEQVRSINVPFFPPSQEPARLKAAAAVEHNLGIYHFKIGEYGIAVSRFVRAAFLEEELQTPGIGITYFNMAQAQHELRDLPEALRCVRLAEEAVERQVFVAKDAATQVRRRLAQHHAFSVADIPGDDLLASMEAEAEAVLSTPGASSTSALRREEADPLVVLRRHRNHHNRPSDPAIEAQSHSAQERELLQLWVRWREGVCFMSCVKQVHAEWLSEAGQYRAAYQQYEQAHRWLESVPRLAPEEQQRAQRLKELMANAKRKWRREEVEIELYHRPLSRIAAAAALVARGRASSRLVSGPGRRFNSSASRHHSYGQQQQKQRGIVSRVRGYGAGFGGLNAWRGMTSPLQSTVVTSVLPRAVEVAGSGNRGSSCLRAQPPPHPTRGHYGSQPRESTTAAALAATTASSSLITPSPMSVSSRRSRPSSANAALYPAYMTRPTVSQPRSRRPSSEVAASEDVMSNHPPASMRAGEGAVHHHYQDLLRPARETFAHPPLPPVERRHPSHPTSGASIRRSSAAAAAAIAVAAGASSVDQRTKSDPTAPSTDVLPQPRTAQVEGDIAAVAGASEGVGEVIPSSSELAAQETRRPVLPPPEAYSLPISPSSTPEDRPLRSEEPSPLPAGVDHVSDAAAAAAAVVGAVAAPECVMRSLLFDVDREAYDTLLQRTLPVLQKNPSQYISRSRNIAEGKGEEEEEETETTAATSGNEEGADEEEEEEETEPVSGVESPWAAKEEERAEVVEAPAAEEDANDESEESPTESEARERVEAETSSAERAQLGNKISSSPGLHKEGRKETKMEVAAGVAGVSASPSPPLSPSPPAPSSLLGEAAQTPSPKRRLGDDLTWCVTIVQAFLLGRCRPEPVRAAHSVTAVMAQVKEVAAPELRSFMAEDERIPDKSVVSARQEAAADISGGSDEHPAYHHEHVEAQEADHNEEDLVKRREEGELAGSSRVDEGNERQEACCAEVGASAERVEVEAEEQKGEHVDKGPQEEVAAAQLETKHGDVAVEQEVEVPLEAKATEVMAELLADGPLLEQRSIEVVTMHHTVLPVGSSASLDPPSPLFMIEVSEGSVRRSRTPSSRGAPESALRTIRKSTAVYANAAGSKSSSSSNGDAGEDIAAQTSQLPSHSCNSKTLDVDGGEIPRALHTEAAGLLVESNQRKDVERGAEDDNQPTDTEALALIEKWAGSMDAALVNADKDEVYEEAADIAIVSPTAVHVVREPEHLSVLHASHRESEVMVSTPEEPAVGALVVVDAAAPLAAQADTSAVEPPAAAADVPYPVTITALTPTTITTVAPETGVDAVVRATEAMADAAASDSPLLSSDTGNGSSLDRRSFLSADALVEPEEETEEEDEEASSFASASSSSYGPVSSHCSSSDERREEGRGEAEDAAAEVEGEQSESARGVGCSDGGSSAGPEALVSDPPLPDASSRMQTRSISPHGAVPPLQESGGTEPLGEGDAKHACSSECSAGCSEKGDEVCNSGENIQAATAADANAVGVVESAPLTVAGAAGEQQQQPSEVGAEGKEEEKEEGEARTQLNAHEETSAREVDTAEDVVKEVVALSPFSPPLHMCVESAHDAGKEAEERYAAQVRPRSEEGEGGEDVLQKEAPPMAHSAASDSTAGVLHAEEAEGACLPPFPLAAIATEAKGRAAEAHMPLQVGDEGDVAAAIEENVAPPVRAVVPSVAPADHCANSPPRLSCASAESLVPPAHVPRQPLHPDSSEESSAEVHLLCGSSSSWSTGLVDCSRAKVRDASRDAATREAGAATTDAETALLESAAKDSLDAKRKNREVRICRVATVYAEGDDAMNFSYIHPTGGPRRPTTAAVLPSQVEDKEETHPSLPHSLPLAHTDISPQRSLTSSNAADEPLPPPHANAEQTTESRPAAGQVGLLTLESPTPTGVSKEEHEPSGCPQPSHAAAVATSVAEAPPTTTNEGDCDGPLRAEGPASAARPQGHHETSPSLSGASDVLAPSCGRSHHGSVSPHEQHQHQQQQNIARAFKHGSGEAASTVVVKSPERVCQPPSKPAPRRVRVFVFAPPRVANPATMQLTDATGKSPSHSESDERRRLRDGEDPSFAAVTPGTSASHDGCLCVPGTPPICAFRCGLAEEEGAHPLVHLSPCLTTGSTDAPLSFSDHFYCELPPEEAAARRNGSSNSTVTQLSQLRASFWRSLHDRGELRLEDGALLSSRSPIKHRLNASVSTQILAAVSRAGISVTSATPVVARAAAAVTETSAEDNRQSTGELQAFQRQLISHHGIDIVGDADAPPFRMRARSPPDSTAEGMQAAQTISTATGHSHTSGSTHPHAEPTAATPPAGSATVTSATATEAAVGEGATGERTVEERPDGEAEAVVPQPLSIAADLPIPHAVEHKEEEDKEEEEAAVPAEAPQGDSVRAPSPHSKSSSSSGNGSGTGSGTDSAALVSEEVTVKTPPGAETAAAAVVLLHSLHDPPAPPVDDASPPQPSSEGENAAPLQESEEPDATGMKVIGASMAEVGSRLGLQLPAEEEVAAPPPPQPPQQPRQLLASSLVLPMGVTESVDASQSPTKVLTTPVEEGRSVDEITGEEEERRYIRAQILREESATTIQQAWRRWRTMRQPETTYTMW